MNPEYLPIAIAGGVAALAVVVALVVWLRRRRRGSDQAIAAIALDRMRSVLVPDGMGGEIQIEHLVLSVGGILVIDVKPFEGILFASDRMDDWTVMAKDGRYAFPNPQGSLYDRVAAVRQLLRDVPVTGYVLFPAGADFSKGRPKDVILPDELAERYKKPERPELTRLTEAFWPHWERVREGVSPADA